MYMRVFFFGDVDIFKLSLYYTLYNLSFLVAILEKMFIV